jgi:molybdate transport system substrate-binding protein
VFAAASAREVLEELAAEFERTSGARVSLSLGPSNQLATQVFAGAPADIFLSASSDWADQLAKAKLSAKDVRLLGNRLALVAADGRKVHAPEDLLTNSVTRVALAGEQVPAGRYAEQALTKLGLLQLLLREGKIVRGSDVRIVLSYVELGEADAGVVYVTDARHSAVSVVHIFDERLHEPIRYPIVLLKRAATNPVACSFFEVLSSDAGKQAFKTTGFAIME